MFDCDQPIFSRSLHRSSAPHAHQPRNAIFQQSSPDWCGPLSFIRYEISTQVFPCTRGGVLPPGFRRHGRRGRSRPPPQHHHGSHRRHGLGRLLLLRQQGGQNPEHRPPRRRGPALRAVLCQLADLLAIARRPLDRPVSPALAHHLLPQQPRRKRPRAAWPSGSIRRPPCSRACCTTQATPPAISANGTWAASATWTMPRRSRPMVSTPR